MIDGVVSNVWQELLRKGEALEDLVRAAEESGLRFVELRQTCLGDYESTDLVPDAVRLRALREQFPGVTLTLALNVPFLGGDLDSAGDLLTAGVEAAEALAGNGGAHLRLVDLCATGEVEIDAQTVDRLVQLAGRLAEKGGVLALENSLHPWAPLLSLFARVRERLGEREECLCICLDPCNVHVQGERGLGEADFPEELRALDLSMFHIKQSRQGILLPVVEEGDVDWARQLRRLHEIGFDGPVLLEIAPSADAWDAIERSRDYLARLEA